MGAEGWRDGAGHIVFTLGGSLVSALMRSARPALFAEIVVMVPIALALAVAVAAPSAESAARARLAGVLRSE